jgi:Rod binding domain-containing protein
MTVQTIPAAVATALPPAQVAKITKSAQQFEAMALGQLLAPMFDTVDSSKGPFGGGEAEAQWKPMLTAELAKHLAAHGGLGLAQPVMQQMLRMQEAAAAGAGA